MSVCAPSAGPPVHVTRALGGERAHVAAQIEDEFSAVVSVVTGATVVRSSNCYGTTQMREEEAWRAPWDSRLAYAGAVLRSLYGG